MTVPLVKRSGIVAPEGKAPEIIGWCPGVLRPMLSGDGWLVRVRPRGGRLSQTQATGIATLAGLHGNGAIQLSGRANVQLRGVREAAIAPLTDALRDLDLLDADAETEGRRNVLMAPDWVAGDGTRSIAAALERGLARKDAPPLPGKFGFAVDVGPLPVLRAAPADVRIERAGATLIVRADGLDRGIVVSERGAAEAALALARWFTDTGGAMEGRGRMAAHLLRDGVVLPQAFAAVPMAASVAAVPAPGQRAAGFLVAIEFGQTDALAFAALAAFGALRMTPWRMVLVEGLREAPRVPGLITRPGDPRLRVVACTGAPGCAQGLQPTRPLARRIARMRTDPLAGPGITHVSGCAKGCAHPGWAERVMVAKPGGWATVIGGRASDPPDGPVWQADTPDEPFLLEDRA